MSTDTSMHQERRGYPPLADLRRSRSDRKLAGVSGGLGQWAGVDPLVFRILFVVLTVFGGSGLLLYALGWLLVPEDGEAESEGQRLFNGRSTTSWKGLLALVVVILLGIAATATLIGSGPGIGGIGVLAVIGVVAVFLLRNGPGPRHVDPAAGPVPGSGPVHGPVHGPVPPPTEPGAYGQTPGTAYSAPVTPAVSTEPLPAYAAAPPAAQTATFAAPPQTATFTPPPAGPSRPTYPVYGPPQPPAPPKERSILGRVTLSVALIVVGVMVGVNTATTDDISARVIFASALLVVGLGLLVGAFIGRARGLVVWGVLLAMLAGAAAVVGDTSVRGGVGDRTWRPATVADLRPTYRLGIGQGELDLTRLDVTGTAGVERVRVRQGVGDLRIIIPQGVVVRLDADVNAGQIHLPDDFEPVDGTDLEEHVVIPAGSDKGAAQLVIDAHLGLGNLEVQYA